MKKGWPITTLAEACQIKPPKSEAREKLNRTDLVSFLPMEAMGVDAKFVQPDRLKPMGEVAGSYTYFADGDVLLAKITPCFENGKLGIASGLKNGIGFGSSEYIVFRPHKSVSSEWLYYLLSRETFRAEGAARMSGAVGHKRVSKEFIAEYSIPVPPVAEQQRIVGLLDEAFVGIATAKANAEKNLQNTRAIFESHLQSVFTQHGPLASLSELADEITDGDHSPPPKAPSGVPFITISDIDKRTRTIDFRNTFTVPQTYFRNLKANKKPLVGDVLYTVTGATLGIPILVREQKDFCFQRHIGLIRPNAKTDSSWLTYALRSPQAFRQATIGSTGAAQKTVSLGVLRGLKLPRVKLTVQKQIAEKLDALSEETERLSQLYERKLVALEALKKSLLHQAFIGAL